jgi:hypothetical protein
MRRCVSGKQRKPNHRDSEAVSACTYKTDCTSATSCANTAGFGTIGYLMRLPPWILGGADPKQANVIVTGNPGQTFDIGPHSASGASTRPISTAGVPLMREIAQVCMAVAAGFLALEELSPICG